MPGVRYWVGKELEPFVRDMLEARKREALTLGVAEDQMPPSSLLAVSGGGDKGAFGAGLLCAWSESGTRPMFKAVTGISTGALIAPFAFLGPEYDHVLRTVYTSLRPEDIAVHRNVLAAIANDAMADNRPLWDQISRYADETLLQRVAAEHAKGRILLIGTTNLDARQPIIWNMGKIAASGAPGALDLFRSILLASAAIPGAFPPMMIDVEADGKRYQEMHVDGGASAQVFIYPARMRTVAAEMGQAMQRDMTLYVIRNSRLEADWEPVQRRTINIAGPAIGSLIHTQGLGDLNRIYIQAQRDGLDFNLAFIDSDFTVPHTTDFDPVWMKALFDYGAQQTRNGYPWKKFPPLLGPAVPS
jgi:predicted acylesterase/phospholipase RssA